MRPMNFRALRRKAKKIARTDDLESVLQSFHPDDSDGIETQSYTPTDEADEITLDNLILPPSSSALKKLQNEDFDKISDFEAMELQAFIEDTGRPVSLILQGQYQDLGEPWSHFNSPDGEIRKRIQHAIPSIGRIELAPKTPGGTATNLGTGFLVGCNLLMTNRHVAVEFVHGEGQRGLSFARSSVGEVDFLREQGFDMTDASFHGTFSEVVMVHPFWDMAILRLREVPPGLKPLKLSVVSPEDLLDREIAVIGYPGKSRDRSERALKLEKKYFGTLFDVKRLAPGEVEERRIITSEATGYEVHAMTHDSSTLPGNSGAALVDVLSGEVIGLHFGGVFFDTNYAVPTFELGRDPRVVDQGVNFVDNIEPTHDWDECWKRADFDPHSIL